MPGDGVREQRAVARLVEAKAGSVEDARLLLDVLGISPEVWRFRWSRVVDLGVAGAFAVEVDVFDVRELTPRDAEFLRQTMQVVLDFEAMAARA